MASEKKKFKKFYLYGSLFWLFITFLFFLGQYLINGYEPYSNHVEFFDGMLNMILIFGVFGIPIIFTLSLFVRLAEYLISRIGTNKNS